MTVLRPLILVCLAVLGGVLPASGQDDSPERTARDSVFSTAQADRGEGVFARVCAQCHTRKQFTESIHKNWEGRTFYEVFEQLRSTMPNDNPGGLSRGQYIDVLVYLLRECGYPAGRNDLGPGESSLRSVRIVPLAPTGPAPHASPPA